jgi:hypothetical protein
LRKTVYTDASFYTYRLTATLLVIPGDVVDTLHDICIESPTVRGEIEWVESKGVPDAWTPVRKTVLSETGGFIEIAAGVGATIGDDDLLVAVTEPTSGIPVDDRKDSKKDANAPGFSDESDPHKTARHDAVEVESDESYDAVTLDEIEKVLDELAAAQADLNCADSAIAIAEYQHCEEEAIAAHKSWGVLHDRVSEFADEYDELVERFNEENPDIPMQSFAALKYASQQDRDAAIDAEESSEEETGELLAKVDAENYSEVRHRAAAAMAEMDRVERADAIEKEHAATTGKPKDQGAGFAPEEPEETIFGHSGP